MRWTNILRLSCAALLVCNGVSKPAGVALDRRQQGTDSAARTLTSNNGAAPSSTTVASTQTQTNSDRPSSDPSPSPTSPPDASSLPSGDASGNATSSVNSTSISQTPTAKSSTVPHPRPTNGTAVHHHQEQQLPVSPRITPGLSIGGVVLILIGVALNIIGVKNKWVHISLSSGLLAGLAVTVLINYVESPPVSNGIQGAYFVGIFMTGLIFGAGSLIFKEVTEGLGCLLGGFCVSMWFMTLKPGGLITNSAGKAIFIAVFCVVFWSLSFSHYTRAYGLIGSTAFSGATAFVIGVDCFSLAGYKEFWFYIWGLNDNLYPLGTTSFPLTRGIRVEIIIIVLATIIGVISQIKLWKIVRDKQKRREEEAQEAERRKDVVEQALGRRLERQNDQDRSNWEKQYGNTLHSKRDTILWSEAHPEQSYTHIPSLAKRMSSSSESLEMSTYGGKKQNKLKRQSSAPSVDVIPEEGEEQDPRTSLERQKALIALENDMTKSKEPVATTKPVDAPAIVPLPFKIPTAPDSPATTREKSAKPSKLEEPPRPSKRQSLQSMLSMSPRLSTENIRASESQEELMLPAFDPELSRPSSIAATLDEENEFAEMERLAVRSGDEPSTPKIIVSPAASFNDLKQSSGVASREPDIGDEPPSPPAFSVDFEFDDPEELSRPIEKATKPSKRTLIASNEEKRLSKETKGSSASESGVKQSSESNPQSTLSTGQTIATEVLTKDALNHVPSQMSNVVMSYRTNEWAKHISTADAPVFDEPATIAETDDEAPTQLAPPRPAEPERVDSSKTLTASSKPPAPHVMPPVESNSAAADAPTPQRTLSEESFKTAPVSPSASHVQIQPIRTMSSKAKRSSWGTSTMKPSLVSTPIDENAPTEFVTQPQSQQPGPVSMPQRMMSNSSATTSKPTITRSSNAQATPIYALDRNNSYTSVNRSDPRMSRSSSVLGNNQAIRSDSRLANYDNGPARSSSVLSNAPAMRSETRLGSYESRQPSKRDSRYDAQKREQLLADWRISQQAGMSKTILPKESVNARMAQMMLDKEHKRLMEDEQRAVHQQKQLQIDQVMRRPDMQDLHREAMRKMQAGAAKKG